MNAEQTTPRVLSVHGAAITDWLADVARLRIRVFRDFPYLYDGDEDYESSYLATYARTPDSILVLALDGDRVVGASTGLPLADEEPEFQAPFHAKGINVDEVYYCGESVLLAEYRGLGLGHRFFDERESRARALGRFRFTAFASVDRASDDPRRPSGHRDNDTFWHGRGYQRQADMTMSLAWKEIGETAESEKQLTFWLRPMEDAQ